MKITKEELRRAVSYNTNRSGPVDDYLAYIIARYQRAEGLDVDGMYGPKTAHSVKRYLDDISATSTEAPPKDRAELIDRFGDPGPPGSAQGNTFYINNIVKRAMPGVAAPFRCHRDLEDIFTLVFNRLQTECPEFKIHTAGCYYHRRIRHSTSASTPLSIHSWGTAVDLNPAENWTRSYTRKGVAPKAFTPAWYAIWPKGPYTVTPEVVKIFQEAGFAWGADWDEDGDTTDHTFIDPMHFEFMDRSR